MGMATCRVQRRRRLRRAKQRNRRSALPWLLVLGLSPLVIGAIGLATTAVVLALLQAHYSEGYVPLEEKIQERSNGLTYVYDRNGPDNGLLLGVLSNPRQVLSEPVELSEISEFLIQATISTEDDSFYDHRGVDPTGLFRAVKENYISGDFGTGTGGSTITQQLVKNVYLSDDCSVVDDEEVCIAPRTVSRKLKENRDLHRGRASLLQGRDPLLVPQHHLLRRPLRRRPGRR